MTLDELRRLEQAATPGPWGIDRDGEMFPVKADGSYDIQGEIAAMVSDNLNDGRLILAARNALPALLRVAEAAAKYKHAEEFARMLDEEYLPRSIVGAIVVEEDTEPEEESQLELAFQDAETALEALWAALAALEAPREH